MLDIVALLGTRRINCNLYENMQTRVKNATCGYHSIVVQNTIFSTANTKLLLSLRLGWWWVRVIIRIKANLCSTELANWN